MVRVRLKQYISPFPSSTSIKSYCAVFSHASFAYDVSCLALYRVAQLLGLNPLLNNSLTQFHPYFNEAKQVFPARL